MPENSPCDSSEVAEGSRRSSSSLGRTILPTRHILQMLRSMANRGKSCIEEVPDHGGYLSDGRANIQSHGKRSHEQIWGGYLSDGRANIQSHGKRSHKQIWGGDPKRNHLPKVCAELLRPADGSISNRILEMQLPTSSSNLQYAPSESCAGVYICSSSDICSRFKAEGLKILTQYNKEEFCSKMPWEDKASTDIYSVPPATDVEDESSKHEENNPKAGDMASTDIYSDPTATDVEDESSKHEENNPKAGDIHGSLDRGMSGHPGFEDFTLRNDAKLQAKIGKIKSLACVNFSSIQGEELLKFVCKLGKMCRSIGMGFNLEPVMLVSIKSTDEVDIQDGLFSVHSFFNSTEKLVVQSKFMLVILPDSRCSDERIDKVCRSTGLPCHCCLPLDARKPDMEYLKNNADKIKTKVIGWKGENLRKDRNANEDEVGDDDTSADEMGGDGTSEDEMGYPNEDEVGDDDTSEDEMGGDGTSEDEMGYGCDDTSQDAAEGSATITATLIDANPQAKSVDVEYWVCLNFSCMRNKDVLRFLCTIGNTCMSIGMNLTPEPTMVIHKRNTYRGMEGSLFTVDTLFQYHGTHEGKKLLLVILPEDRFCKDLIVDACQSLGFLYQCCLPHRVRMASEKYFKYAAKKIKAKVLGCDIPPCPDEDISQDDDLKEIWDVDKDIEGGSKQLEICYVDEDIEDGSKQFDNSDDFHNLYGEHDKSGKL